MSHKRVVIRYRFLTKRERVDPKMRKDARRVRVFADASHAGCSRTRKSTTAGVSMRGPHNVGDFVATQVPISLSSGESEFYALLRAAVEAKFLYTLLSWLDFEEMEAPELVSDATAALGAAARLGVGKRMKHMDTQALFIQKEVNENRLKLKKCKGEDNPADAGTKPLQEARLKRLLSMVGVKFLTTAVLASRVQGAAGQLVHVGRNKNLIGKVLEKTMVVMEKAKDVAIEVAERLQDTMNEGVTMTDVVMAILPPLAFEIIKEVIKTMLVEKIRGLPCWCPCRKRTRTRKRKNMFAVAGSRVMHKKKECYHIKNKESQAVKVCIDCAHCETEEEEEDAQTTRRRT